MVDRELSSFTRSLMKIGSRRGDPNRPVSLWREMDNLRGFPEETAVVILRTTGCAWYRYSSCTMCGYFNDVSPAVTRENLMEQIRFLSSSISDIKVLKVFTSGSFLDPLEIPPDVRDFFFSMLGSVEKFLVESRTEYLTKKNLDALTTMGSALRIAIGLESSNDILVEKSINKGTTFAKFKEAATVVRDAGLETRTYLLFKPPFISELSAIEDALKSISDASPYSHDISVNPMNIQRNTLVEYLWKRALYRPPRLISLARVLMESLKKGIRVVSYPTAGNRIRGVHDDNQNAELLKAIYEASLTGSYSRLEDILSSMDMDSYMREMEIEEMLPMASDYGRMVDRLFSSSIAIP